MRVFWNHAIARASNGSRDQRVDAERREVRHRPKISTARACSTGNASGLSTSQGRSHSGSAEGRKEDRRQEHQGGDERAEDLADVAVVDAERGEEPGEPEDHQAERRDHDRQQQRGERYGAIDQAA